MLNSIVIVSSRIFQFQKEVSIEVEVNRFYSNFAKFQQSEFIGLQLLNFPISLNFNENSPKLQKQNVTSNWSSQWSVPIILAGSKGWKSSSFANETKGRVEFSTHWLVSMKSESSRVSSSLARGVRREDGERATCTSRGFGPGAGSEMLCRWSETRLRQKRTRREKEREREREEKAQHVAGRQGARPQKRQATTRPRRRSQRDWTSSQAAAPVWKQLHRQPAPENYSVAWRDRQAAPSVSSASAASAVHGRGTTKWKKSRFTLLGPRLIRLLFAYWLLFAAKPSRILSVSVESPSAKQQSIRTLILKLESSWFSFCIFFRSFAASWFTIGH